MAVSQLFIANFLSALAFSRPSNSNRTNETLFFCAFASISCFQYCFLLSITRNSACYSTFYCWLNVLDVVPNYCQIAWTSMNCPQKQLLLLQFKLQLQQHNWPADVMFQRITQNWANFPHYIYIPTLSKLASICLAYKNCLQTQLTSANTSPRCLYWIYFISLII